MKAFIQHIQAFCASDDTRAIASIFEKQVLLFPVLVVLLACTSFFFGGHCATWQWWTAIVIILMLPFVKVKTRNNVNEAIFGDLLFLVFLVVLWLVVPVICDIDGNTDYSLYHFPQIRLLIYGWNPVDDPMGTATLTKLGLDKAGMSYYHVAFIAKLGAVFNAVAYNFFHDPLAISWPLCAFIFTAVVLVIVRVYRCRSYVVACFGVVATWYGFKFGEYIDAIVFLSAVGLVFTLFNAWRSKYLDYIALFVFSFWLINLKLPAALATFSFWLIFSLSVILRYRSWFLLHYQRLLLVGMLLCATFLIASYSPYFTSFRDYGHPLYPFKTCDAEKYPLHNLTGEFTIGNDDYKNMGYFGEFFNAYVSPCLVQKYYNWQLNRCDFHPHKFVWDHSFDDTAINFPCAISIRIALWSAIIVLLLIPASRVFGIMMLLSLFLIPREYFGFMRYQQWLFSFEILAACMFLDLIVDKRNFICMSCKKFILCVLTLCACVGLIKIARTATRNLIVKDRVRSMEEKEILVCYFDAKSPLPLTLMPELRGKPLYIAMGGMPTLNNSILLLKQLNMEDVAVKYIINADLPYQDIGIFNWCINRFKSLNEYRLVDKIRMVIEAWLGIYPQELMRHSLLNKEPG